jgi:hypothetical protein
MKLRQNGTVFLMIKLAASMAGPGLNSKQISFFSDQTGRFSGQRRRSYETSSVYGKMKVGPTTLARHT